jgi:putative ABC transport system substrate-binding protein
MDRRTFLPGIALGLLATLRAAHAQPSAKVPRIGLLLFDAPIPGTNIFLDAFMEGLRDRGYVEGQNLVIERRYAQGRPERAAEFAAELVRIRVDVIVIFGPGPLQAARQATQTIPLVMLASSSDPVADGIAQSLARPGGNITGLTYAVSAERFGKQLELLKLAVGAINRVAVLWDLDLETFRKFWAVPLKDAGRVLDLSVMPPTQVRDTHELPAAFSQIKQQQADAVLVATGGPINAARTQVAELAIAHRLQ